MKRSLFTKSNYKVHHHFLTSILFNEQLHYTCSSEITQPSRYAWNVIPMIAMSHYVQLGADLNLSTRAFRSCGIVRWLSFEAGRPVPFTFILLAEQFTGTRQQPNLQTLSLTPGHCIVSWFLNIASFYQARQCSADWSWLGELKCGRNKLTFI